jgi:hypothetical protein
LCRPTLLPLFIMSSIEQTSQPYTQSNEANRSGNNDIVRVTLKIQVFDSIPNITKIIIIIVKK